MVQIVSHSQESYPDDLTDMETWIRSHARPGHRILEIGCGDGALVRRLAADRDIIGVDPHGEPGDHVRVEPFEELDTAPFDIVFASVSLHHLADFDAATAALHRLTAPGSIVLVREFDRALVDHEPTLRWWYEHRRLLPDDPDDRQLADSFDEFVPDWRQWMEHHVAPWSVVSDMLRASKLEMVSEERMPYLFRWGLDERLRPEEERLAAAGAINLVGHRWTGRRR